MLDERPIAGFDMKKALCIEDDPVTATEIASELTRAGFQVETAPDGHSGLQRALTGEFDVITLDRMLPGLDGIEVVSRMRTAGVRTPVVMVSALSDVDDRVQGLRAGGDEYLVKPFASEELSARVQVLLHRQADTDKWQTILRVANLSLDLIERELRCDNHRMNLQPVEFKLLEFFMRNANQVLTRSIIFEAVWGYHFDPGTKLIDVHLTRVRRKLESIGGAADILNVRGLGFVLSPR